MLSHWKTRKRLESWYKSSRSEWISIVRERKLLEPKDVMKFGNVGCIVSTDNPKIVMKITDKEEEFQILDYLRESETDGFVKVYDILELKDGDYKVWFIWREYLDIVEDEAIEEVAKNQKKNLENFKARLVKMLKVYEDCVLSDPIPFIEQMKKMKGFDKAAEGILGLTTRGLIVSDIRPGNIGVNIGGDQLTIFDSMINTSSYLPEDYDEEYSNEYQEEDSDDIDIWT
jgi:hypothetical protein